MLKQDDLVDIDRVRRGVLSSQESEAVSEELERYRSIYTGEKKVTVDDFACSKRTVTTHPSYAVCNISRVSGSADLFDSKIKHQHYISLSISTARVGVSDGYRSIMGDREIIEVDMSETQFARLITSMNCGSGSPCTLNHFMCNSVTRPPKEESDLGDHRKRIKEMSSKSIERIKSIVGTLSSWISEKKRPTLKEVGQLHHEASCIVGNIPSNMAYVHDLLHEVMEERVDEAKTEIEVHIAALNQRLGLEALHQKIADSDNLRNMQFLIEDKASE